MGSDGVLRVCLVSLGAAVLAVGIFTFSFRKAMATYVFGLVGIAGILLPDWEFFDRDFSHWFSPMPLHPPTSSDRVPSIGSFKLYPLRVALITTIYSFGLYKWWLIMCS
ncbi:signal peptidase complex-like protein DTM1 isoform X1 [Iris pallida]|uniref:Signal peptidase complex-like protein DTM1 isoform X1 n=1 Tax=Iris pallida TaxID=29817 RepID=A0AAX6FPT9_IRIPA|nr:signal peptidase complex-like protein DTM1 isoform X1 [Iris pallida]KAJ6837731.1 signal peptidase complex-like protein DTM1 isoform X1 [Iris pallida]